MNEIIGYSNPGGGLLAWKALVDAFLGLVAYRKRTRMFVAGLVMGPFRQDEDPQELRGRISRFWVFLGAV
jgi:hypothetical protein